MFTLGSIVLLIVVGSLLEGLPALIILGPLLMPIAGQYGIDIIHYSMIMILAMGVGIFIPPIGIGFYVSCRSRKPPGTLRPGHAALSRRADPRRWSSAALPLAGCCAPKSGATSPDIP